jgi:hypothetical protein
LETGIIKIAANKNTDNWQETELHLSRYKDKWEG